MTPHAALAEFLIDLELVGPKSQALAIKVETLRTGGTWLVPPEGDNSTSHLIEISLHTILGRGTTMAEAVSDWTRAAHCAVRHLDHNNGLIAVSMHADNTEITAMEVLST